MGGEPVSALQLVCWPRDEISFDVLAEVINGGLDIMAEAGCTVIGGHSIDDKEPKYGFSVTGVIKENPILNNNILDKDKLFITKPLGIGIIIMASLNKKAMEFAKDNKANAITDVTGFGLLGHLSEMLKGSKLSATIYSEKVPVISGVEKLLDKDIFPSGSKRNLESIRDKLIFDIDNKKIQIFSDAQTSGGLLISLPKNVNIETKEVNEKYGIDVWEIGEITTQYNEKINII